MPHRERYLLICTNRRADGHPKGSCAERGGEALLPALKAALNLRGLGLTARACGTTCLDLCEIGAVVLQEPEHVAYGNVVAADVDELADAVARGGVLERLVVRPPPIAS
jgi:(2Fe-2S) ferredoxin